MSIDMNIVYSIEKSLFKKYLIVFFSQAGPGGTGRSAAGECASLVRVAEAHSALSL